MSTSTSYPTSEQELRDFVLAHRSIQIVGRETKGPLVQAIEGASRVSLVKLNRVLDHQPSEFLVTTQAGVSIAELAQTLATHGQYLPFNPPLGDLGASVGGTVAAGLSGPARMRHGGLRDFIVGIRLVDGLGQAIVGGGKVVKNAAGYDFPKLLVGSCGNLGAITEVTFKVFPQPVAARTLGIACPSLPDAVQLQAALAKLPIEWSAIDLIAPVQLVVRFEGSVEYLDAATARIVGQTTAIQPGLVVETIADEMLYWKPFDDGSLVAKNQWLLRVPMTPSQLMELDRAIEPLAAARRYSVAGNLAWFTIAEWTQVNPLSECLSRFGLSGTIMLGPQIPAFSSVRVHIGKRPSPSMLKRVKAALDPEGRFVSPA